MVRKRQPYKEEIMDATTQTAQDLQPETIEFGGVTWTREDRNNGVAYKATQPGKAGLDIYQYPPDGSSCCNGKWRWAANFNIHTEIRIPPQVLELEGSNIVATREDAMAACVNAFDDWIEDMQTMLARLCPQDLYAQGFCAGQEDIKDKIAKVLA